MPRFFRKAIPIPRRARGGIRKSARCHDHTVTFIFCRLCRHRTDRFRFDPDLCNRFPEFNFDTNPAASLLQRFCNIACVVTDRKYTVTALHLQRESILFKELHCPIRRKRVCCTGKKFPPAHDIGQEFIRRTIIGQIATPFSCNINLFAELFVFLEQSNVFSVFRCGICRHESGSTSADDNYFFHGVYLFFL